MSKGRGFAPAVVVRVCRSHCRGEIGSALSRDCLTTRPGLKVPTECDFSRAAPDPFATARRAGTPTPRRSAPRYAEAEADADAGARQRITKLVPFAGPPARGVMARDGKSETRWRAFVTARRHRVARANTQASGEDGERQASETRGQTRGGREGDERTAGRRTTADGRGETRRTDEADKKTGRFFSSLDSRLTPRTQVGIV